MTVPVRENYYILCYSRAHAQYHYKNLLGILYNVWRRNVKWMKKEEKITTFIHLSLLLGEALRNHPE